MDQEQIRIQADLSGLLDGEVTCDPLFTQMYASDASVYEIQPLGVARPRSTRDVSELLSYCFENQIAVFPRGGGSGLAGQALGRGIVADFSRYMRRIQTPNDGKVRVQAGVVQADLNRALGYHNWLFGPDPASRSVSTIGSMLSIDSSGSHFPKYGSAGDCVDSLQVVLASGEVVELGQHPWASDLPQTDDSVVRLAQQAGLLLQQNGGLLMRPPWQNIARGCGYRLEKALDGDLVNLARLLCGAEGTLAVITEATLRLHPVPPVRGLILLFFSRLESAARAALDLGGEEICACDLMDRRLLEIARETEHVYDTIVPRGAEAMLLVEIDGEDSRQVRSRLLQIQQRLQKRGKPVISYRLTTDREERNLLWRLVRRVIPRLYKLKGNLRPLPFLDDLSIPPDRLPDFLHEVQNILKAERVTATLFAHALHGSLDVRPFLDLADPSDQLRLSRLSETFTDKVLEFGGCVSGHHALGLSKASWAERQLGPRLELCRKIKRLFDPAGILNPGKFLSPTPPKVNEHLRSVPSPDPVEPVAVGNGRGETDVKLLHQEAATQSATSDARADDQHADNGHAAGNASDSSTLGDDRPSLPVILDWGGPESLAHAARACNGCGRCRTSGMAERMCPMFRVHKGEESSPRAKANLLRGLLTGSLGREQLERIELKAISDLCFNCHQCRLECPANVNIPKLVQETKAQHVASHGLPLSERLLNRVDVLTSFARRFPRLANWSLSSAATRWLLEKTAGVSRSRKLPRVARRTFLRWAARERLNRMSDVSGKKVAFFVDQYVNWHNPLLGRALIEVLRHQHVEVYIPTNQTPSWMAMIAAGDIEKAKRLAATNIRILAEAARQGYAIVTTEPSAALCLKEEYRHLISSEDTELIAANTYEISSYLWSLHTRNELELDFRPTTMSVVYHEPCHARILDARRPALKLLELIPGLQIQVAEAGCSGMAGTFGLQSKNFRTSLRIGWGLISTMKETTAQFGTTECTACKLQMEQATTKPTVHPVALLAYAYGGMPQLAAWFSSRTESRLVH